MASAITTAYSPPVGGMTIPAAASTDSFVSVALANNAAWVGTVASVAGSDITVTGTPSWTANVYTASAYYYVRMLSGAQMGHYFSILANGAGDVTVDNAGLNLSVINAGDTMEIVPYWTLGTLYPASQAGVGFTASTSSYQTELLVFDASATGINRSASAIFFFYSGHWRQIGKSLSTFYDNTIIYPDTYVIQRNTAAATALVYTGRVQPSYLGTILTATAATQNDNFVALSYPVDVTLNGTGLATSAFTASVSGYKDQLLWFDPAGTGINRSAAYIYYYYNGGWRRIGASTSTDFGSTVLKAGSGFVIRKAANGTTASWVFSTGI